MNGGWQDLMVERILLLVLPQVTYSFCTKNEVVVVVECICMLT